MGAGLCDPASATLGRLYDEGRRSAITKLTLFGGFASTVCWPLSVLLQAHLGWRGACLVYALAQLAVAVPVYLYVLPRENEDLRVSADRVRIDHGRPGLGSRLSHPLIFRAWCVRPNEHAHSL
jgi:predicted MFS family arabinose efflux permease